MPGKSVPAKSIYDRGYRVLVECLRTARHDAKVTQAELAAKLRANQSYVSKYERAERRLDIIEVRAICSALGLDFLQIVERFEKAIKRVDIR